ncbi:hypothetical protein MtrunA17_Chr2g0283931 [Medicago truncatula]|uniref:Uncharacterized protein n=1 Tax=Medicago truncatula TaxID=3880 RepID=A0A396J5L8_MEDTR|nr:hypothetical protein MtrunA17_Chr2g0283931 [Medicago truncatula]
MSYSSSIRSPTLCYFPISKRENSLIACYEKGQVVAAHADKVEK